MLNAAGAPFYQVWSVILIGGGIVVVGAIYFVIARPDRRTRSVEEVDAQLSAVDELPAPVTG